MSFSQCLAQLEQDGVIDGERADRFRDEYQRLNAAYAKRMGETVAADLAGRDTMDALERQALRQRRQEMLQIDAQSRILTHLVKHIEDGGNVAHFATAVMEHRESVQGARSVENTRAGLFQLAWSRMDDFLSRYHRDLLGRVRNADELKDVVRAMRGEKVASLDAKEMAASVDDTMEWLRQQFNMAGGDIPKLDNRGAPQSHDALEIARSGFDDWWAFHRPLLDVASMTDNSTGKAFASEDALTEAAQQAYRNITSHGLDGQVPGAFTSQGKVANRRMDHRFFVYKDADAWLKYNERFGSGDVFNAIAGQIDSMTRDIAAMQTLGPNPALSVRWLGDLLRQEALPPLAGGDPLKLGKSARKGADTLNTMWDYYSGALTGVAPEYRGQARFFSGVKNWNVVTKLGRAFLSAAPTDPVFMGITAKFNNLLVTQMMADYVKLLNPASEAHRSLARHSGLIFTDMITRGEQMWREGRGMNVHELTRRGADGLLRVSLLTPHTVAAKQALGLGFMRDWARASSKDFGSLHGVDRLALQRYGIDATDWDRLRSTPVFNQDGVKILRPGDLARDGSQDAINSATKFMSLIDGEVRFGVPGESLRASAAIASINNPRSALFKRGTLGGELLHSTMQFKTYSAIMMMTQLERAIYGRGGMNRIAYALAVPTLLTLGGLVRGWMIDISNGKDPAPLDNPLTWERAVFGGGGLGIVGDLISQGFSGSNQAGGGVIGFLAGPTLSSVITPAYNLTFGNIGAAAQGKQTHLSSELAMQARSQMPGGNLWYTQLAFNRLWADQLQEWADPHYRQSFGRMERKAQQEGSPYFWHPGDSQPERGPDVGNVTTVH